MSISFPTGDFVTTSLIGSIDSSQDTATIGAGLTLPATNGVLVIDYDSTAAVGAASGPETITYATYTTATGALAGITRGLAGTTGVTHANTASVQCSSSALLYTEVSDRLTAVQAGAALALIDGWQDPAETWTYASATSITVPAGNLLKRAVGDKVKLNQSIPLSAYWPMEDKDDDIIPATVANIGTPTYTAGKFSNALTLNGTDQALAITDAAVFKPTGAFTVGAWVNATDDASDKYYFQSYSDNTNANGIILVVNGTTGTVRLLVGSNAADNVAVCTTTSKIAGGWHYVVVSCQGNHAKIFVDGVLEASGYMATPTYAATNYVRIGCQNSAGSNAGWFKGQIDDLFFINGHAVDQYWVAAKYAAGTAQSTANITATYQGYVTAVTDTLLTLTGGADYALYNGTITSPYYSHANPVGFPQTFNWAATPLGWAATPTTTAKFSLVCRDVSFELEVSGTSNSTSTSFTAPITSLSTGVDNTRGVALGVDNGADLATPISWYVPKNSLSVTVAKTFGTAASWTASSTKAIFINGKYRI